MKAFLLEAQELLKSIEKINLSLDERQSLAIKLSSLIIKSSQAVFSEDKKKQNLKLIKNLQSLNIRAFLLNLIDHAFHAKNKHKNSQYLNSLINQHKVTFYLPFNLSFKLLLFKFLSKALPSTCINIMKKEIKRILLILVGIKDKNKLLKSLKNNSELCLAYVKEKVVSPEEAETNMTYYLNWLLENKINCISLNPSAIISEIHFNDNNSAINVLADNLQEIYQVASYNRANPKMVILGLEDYKYLYPTIEAFKKALEKFPYLKAGITLQAYLPESFHLQKDLTAWAKQRVEKGGAPIEICLVKGGYLSSEQIKASQKGWPQTPFTSKSQTDANFKRMAEFGLKKENTFFAHLTIGTHNIFDLAYCLVLMKENGVEKYTKFQMIKGPSDHISTVLSKLLPQQFRISTAFIEEKDYYHAMPYIIRRIEELTGTENFLKYALEISPRNEFFEKFQTDFLQSFEKIKKLPTESRRFQLRKVMPSSTDIFVPFNNEPDTDFTLPINQQWKNQILKQWQNYCPGLIPLCIGGKIIDKGDEKKKNNPSNPYLHLYKYLAASETQIQTAIDTAKKNEQNWRLFPVEKKKTILAKAAQLLREKRADLIGALMLDTAKILKEADAEISQTIDMLEYYILRIEKVLKIKDVIIKPKGTVSIFSSRAFPLSVPTGGIAAALLTGNCVLFHPASDAIFSGWMLSSILWKAGIPKEVLQFFSCDNEKPLLQDLRLTTVILTGRAATTEKFLNINPLLDLNSASEGKNIFIVSAFSDKKRAIKNLLSSAFDYSGQKYSSVSIAILEKKVFEDKSFLQTLKEAAANLKVGSIWDEKTKIGPLIRAPDKQLLKALTSLEEGESWLLQPRQDLFNPNLFSPGIKINLKPDSLFFKQFLPGPILGLIKADNFTEALELADSTDYGLCTVLDSLSDKEIMLWKTKVKAGNYYCNRHSHGTIIRRQPFGGYKKSAFGLQYKAGGPNYLLAFMVAHQTFLPTEKRPVSEEVNNLSYFLSKFTLSAEALGIWYASCANYAYWWHRMQLPRDPNKIVGEDNFFGYIPRNKITLRIYPKDRPLDFLRITAAALTCKATLNISVDKQNFPQIDWQELSLFFPITYESEEFFLQQVREKKISRIRLAGRTSAELKQTAALALCYVDDAPVLANGRWELLHYLKEFTFSHAYHRFGNLGTRLSELRKPLL